MRALVCKTVPTQGNLYEVVSDKPQSTETGNFVFKVVFNNISLI